MVYGDRFRIRQVLINLMGNAVKFTAQGEVYTRCSVLRKPGISLKPSQILLNFEVVDTGKGFSAADAQRLMQRFSQIGEDSSQHNAGSGLGLFLSKQLVEMHGGELTPSSQEGRGAKFSFYVKVDAPKPPDSAIPRPVSEAADSAVSESPKSSSHEPLTPADPSDSTVATPHVSSSSPADDSSAGISLQEQLSPPSNIEPGREKAGERDAPQPQLVQPPALLEPPSAEIPRKHDSGYSIVILCPLDHAREAIKQHIEQVVPLEVPASVTSLADVDDWKDIMYTQGARAYTHLVVNSPECDDVLETMQCLQELDADQRPRLVIISDHYQKRKINAKLEELVSSCIQVDTVPKPVKPSSFSSIFDPDNRRDLSKDRNQDMAQEVNNNFKTMSKMVKEVVGNKGHRVLLVEDDETNRMVMLKYLDKIKLLSETATNGQECLDMVFSKEPGYYSLIICDIQMPVKNGYDTCREIRAWEAKNHFPQIPIMALSANAMTDQIDDAARAGFNDYVTKPIKHNELGKMIMKILDPNRPHNLLPDRRNDRAKQPAQ